MNSEKIIKIGSVELYQSDVEMIYNENKYVVNYSGVYQIFYSQAQRQYYGKCVYRCKGLTLRGRFFIKDGAAVNKLIGHELLN